MICMNDHDNSSNGDSVLRLIYKTGSALLIDKYSMYSAGYAGLIDNP